MIKVKSDTTLNDSDKTLTVPDGLHWWIKWAYVDYTSTGTVGNRSLALRVHDAAGNTILQLRRGIAQAESLTRYYNFFPATPQGTAFSASALNIALPPRLLLPAAYDIQFLDLSAVDAAADDMLVHVFVDEFAYGG